ncbi:MAG: diguanylate cyclase [Cyanobacteria bacterium P01_H01_bin.74]
MIKPLICAPPFLHLQKKADRIAPFLPHIKAFCVNGISLISNRHLISTKNLFFSSLNKIERWHHSLIASLNYDEKNNKTKIKTADLNTAEFSKFQLSANTLNHLWDFICQQFLITGQDCLILLSIVDSEKGYIDTRFIQCVDGTENTAFGCKTPLDMHHAYLVKACKAQDTVFCRTLESLSEAVQEKLDRVQPCSEKYPINQIFTLPLITSSQPIALITVGFKAITPAVQERLSYFYTIRNPLAQVCWNILLQAKMAETHKMDALTGVSHHSAGQDILQTVVNAVGTTLQNASIVLFDINGLADINRDYGYLAGDSAIQVLGETICQSMRSVDTVVRHNNDEFLLILPNSNRTEATLVTKTILADLFLWHRSKFPYLSVSAGLATCKTDRDKTSSSSTDLVKKSEHALQIAKYRLKQHNQQESIKEMQFNCSAYDELSYEKMPAETKHILTEVFTAQVLKKQKSIQLSTADINQIKTNAENGLSAFSLPDNTEALTLESLTSLAGALEAKDRYTQGHSHAVENYAVLLGKALKMTPSELEKLRIAAFLHDIGKIGIPEYILNKTTKLNEKEWEIMKQHPVIGAQQIIYPVKSLRDIAPAVECHHENWDGSGHPYGYQGSKIPIGAQIISVVDVFHAITSTRSYRTAMSLQEAKHVMQQYAGIKWNGKLLDVFLTLISKNEKIT